MAYLSYAYISHTYALLYDHQRSSIIGHRRLRLIKAVHIRTKGKAINLECVILTISFELVYKLNINFISLDLHKL
jgi:hypothetical protein